MAALVRPGPKPLEKAENTMARTSKAGGLGILSGVLEKISIVPIKSRVIAGPLKRAKRFDAGVPDPGSELRAVSD